MPVSAGAKLKLDTFYCSGMWQLWDLRLHQKVFFLTRGLLNTWLSRSMRAWKVSKCEIFLVRVFLLSDWIKIITNIQFEYRKIRPRKNSVFGHFSRSEWVGHTPLKIVLSFSFSLTYPAFQMPKSIYRHKNILSWALLGN